jgi:hypothetical protein
MNLRFDTARLNRAPPPKVNAPLVRHDEPPKAAPSETVSTSSEPTREDCLRVVAKARALAEALPAEHLSRYFAERNLQQSMTEAGNGEFDDCLYWAERATEEVQGLHHELKPGETLKIRRADE